MILTTVLGVVPAPMVQAAEPTQIVVKGGDALESIGTAEGEKEVTWNGAAKGTETDSEGNEVSYCQMTDSAYANALWNVTFDKPGVYKMSFLAAAQKAVPKFHIEYRINNEETRKADNNFTTIVDGQEYFAVTDTDDAYNHYQVFDTPEITVNIRTAGEYTFKIGNWRAGDAAEGEDVTDFKLAEIRFEPALDPDVVYAVKADAELVLQGGLLNPAESEADYMDYKLNVETEGDYTLTYTLGQNNSTFGESGQAFQVILNPEEENETVNPAMVITKYYQELPVKQTIHLPAGEQVLRVKALVGGFSIRNIAINSKIVNSIEEPIPAAQYENADNYHAIETDGNLGYTAEGLKVDYSINVEKPGTYTISYENISRYAAVLETQIDGVKVAETSLDASTAGTWYETDYVESDTTGISFHLEKGQHTLSVVWGSADINVKSIKLTCKTPDPDPVTIVVEGEDGVSGSGAWAAVDGEETVNGEVVKYATFPQQWANGRYIVHFPYAGTYKMQLVMSVPTLTDSIHLEWAPTTDEYTAAADGTFTVVSNDIPGITATADGEYKTFDGPNLVVEEPGYYDLKFGSWVAGADFRLDKFIFSCDSPLAPPSTDEPLVVEKGKELTLKEALAVNKKGSLKANPASGDYADYAIEVKESGDYRLTYSVGANSAAVEDAFQVQVAPQKEELTDADFTTKLEPVQMTRYYVAILERQSIHLEAGSYVLRTKALNEGFILSQLTISDALVTDVASDKTATTINAVDFNNGTNYHAIQNVTATAVGNIGYASQGLGLDYEVNISEGGVYSIAYAYQTAGDYTLTTQRVADGEVYDLATSQLVKSTGASNWYDCEIQTSEGAAILLPAGQNTIRVYWDQADTNLHSLTLTYQGSAVEYVTGLLTDLPSKDTLTLEDEAAVVKAKNSYDTLTAEEQAQIDTGLVTKLVEDMAQISALQLAKAVADNQAELTKEFSKYVESEYREEKWAEVVAAKDAGMKAISDAATIAEADKALKDAKAAMAAVVKKLKAIAITADGTVILAQSKAYRKNGFLNSNVAVGNYADYFIDVKEAGVYTFTYALYADEAVENAFAVKYDVSEYPETVTNEYVKVSVPKIEVEGSLVKEIRGTVTLNAGEQTLRFEALSDKVRLNRITIQKQKTAEVGTMEPGEAKVVNASDFAAASGNYVLANNVITGTSAGTALDYLVSIPQETAGFVSYNYAYTGSGEPELELVMVAADGTETKLASVKAAATEGTFADSEQAVVVLPEGTYTLRVIMKNDGVELKSFVISGEQKNIPAEGIKLNVYKVNLSPQGTFQLTGILQPENTTAGITWSSSDEEVATVENGLITAVQDGTAVITASADGKTAECTVIVGDGAEEPPVPVQEVLTLSAEDIRLNAGGSFQLIASVEPEGEYTVTWSSSDETVAKVDANGLVTAVKSGTAVITASTANGVTAECKVNVNKEEQGQQGQQGQIGSKPGKTPSFIAKVEAQFDKTMLYAGGNADNTAKAELVIPTGAALAKAEYASSDASVASVSAAGVVTAKKAGTAVITVKVTLTNGESASLQKQITVKKAYIKLKKAKYTVKKGKSVQLKATAFGSSKKVTFTIANKKGKKLAKVTKAGKLTGKAKGTVKVTAKSGKVKKTFKVKVK